MLKDQLKKLTEELKSNRAISKTADDAHTNRQLVYRALRGDVSVKNLDKVLGAVGLELCIKGKE